jgi:F-type H+-transporting ATPase subunit c
MIQVAKIIETGLATTGLIGVGIGVVFNALMLDVARNLFLKDQLFTYAILEFAFSEVTGLFALIMTFLLLYVA